MDEKRVPAEDCGNVGSEEPPTESYAEVFDFLSLTENDAAGRSDYTACARKLVKHIINEAAKGPAAAENFTCNGSRAVPALPPQWSKRAGPAFPLRCGRPVGRDRQGIDQRTQPARCPDQLRPGLQRQHRAKVHARHGGRAA